MPVYEYQCGQCSLRFEQFFTSMRSAASAPTPECVECGSPDTRRCISQFAQLRPLNPGPGRAAYPTSWTQANAGDPESISYWKRRVEREMSQESRDPGLKIERELTAERQWNEAVMRSSPAGEVGKDSGLHSVASEPGLGPVIGHGHGHDHPHPHPHAHESAGTAPQSSAHSHGDSTHSHDEGTRARDHAKTDPTTTKP